MPSIQTIQIHGLKSFGERCPAAQNFLDLLQNRSPDQLSQYRFFSDGENLGSFAPDRSIQIYGISEHALERMFEFITNHLDFKPGRIFGDIRLDAWIQKKWSVKKYNPFRYLRLQHPKIHATDDSVRKAGPEDQEWVNQWFSLFNQEQGSIWDTPVISSLTPHQSLYLSIKDGVFLGGGANTLSNPQRFWVGRLFVPPEQRRFGIASKIMNQIETDSAQSGRTVDLQVNHSNESATQFYMRRGYQPLSENAYWNLS